LPPLCSATSYLTSSSSGLAETRASPKCFPTFQRSPGCSESDCAASCAIRLYGGATCKFHRRSSMGSASSAGCGSPHESCRACSKALLRASHAVLKRTFPSQTAGCSNFHSSKECSLTTLFQRWAASSKFELERVAGSHFWLNLRRSDFCSFPFVSSCRRAPSNSDCQRP
jgi:hypothetical protein